MAEEACKLLVIGGGPGGYVCAIRAGQLGLDTIVVDEAELGGACLTVGCIPSKALIHAADEFHKARAFASGSSALGIRVSGAEIDLARTVAWKDGIVRRLTGGVAGLLKKAGVRTMKGTARFRDGKTVIVRTAEGEKRVRAENVVIATGASPIELDGLAFGGDVISSTEALSLGEVPERLAIVGAGYIGLEIGTAYAKLGSKVTVVEAADRILPLWDDALTRPVAKRLAALGVDVRLSTKASGRADDGLLIATNEGGSETIPCDKILVTIGRRARTGAIGLDELDLTMSRAFIEVDDKCRTSMRGVFAIGDVTGEPMLAHRAMAQGEMVAEIIGGHKRAWDRLCVPAVCFTDPEIVSAGLSPDEAAAKGVDVTVGTFPFRANGRAMTLERDDGFVRVVARASDNAILGVQAVGPGVSELSAAFAIAIEMGARADDIGAIIHAHPTLSEAFHEASLGVLGHSLHF
jgi:dihydrolipoamide dehydrogenase